MPSIISLLNEKNVFAHLKAETKDDVLSRLISSFEEETDAEELEAIRQAVFEREKIMSTGVGKGLAIPHGKAKSIDHNYVAFALLDTPIDYEAIDDKPVRMVFLLAGPSSSNSLHIKMLSRISRLMNNKTFRDQLKSCSTSQEIIDVFDEGESSHFG